MNRSNIFAAFSIHCATFSLIVGTICMASVASDQPPQEADAKSRPAATVWKGKISIPGMPLDYILRITRDADGVTKAMIDIPAQGARKLELTDVKISGRKMKFTLPAGAPAVFNLDVAASGKTAEGTMNQFGQDFPVTAELTNEADAAQVGPARPQTPKPPFPYRSEEVTFTNEKDSTTLAGTLTLPDNSKPHAAVVLITGSGPQDRDETLFAHKPFFVIADHLTRHGIAVLRYDDRGVGESKAGLEVLRMTTTRDLAGDAAAAVRFLRTRKDIDPKRIALAGHSEGGIIAPLVAADDPKIAGIILLAGSGVPGGKVLSGQLERINLTAGVSRENVDRQLKAQAKWMDLFVKGGPIGERRAALRELVVAQLEASGVKPDDAKIEKAVDTAMESEGSEWMRTFITLDPRDALRKVHCPVLAMNGSLDTQVIPDDNLPEIEKALAEAGNKDVTIKRLPRLNHLFQHAASGAPSEYTFIEETIADEALSTMTDWLTDRLEVTNVKEALKESGD